MVEPGNQSQIGLIKEIFSEVCDLPSSERQELIARRCGTDAQLRTAVMELLDANDSAGRFLADPDAANAFNIEKLPRELGAYTLLEVIGEGGFGTVYLAEQRRPLKRRVALKVIKAGMDTRQVIARFDAERQALAMMDHPNIARVFDAGATDAGRPYFVMELVHGIPITQYCEQNGLSIRQRLELMAQVCSAIQHAHQKGLIHRDLKPSNVLVSTQDGAASPKIIDFGIAKATQGRLGNQTVVTELRHLMGTPQYMSPEQADMGAVDLDTRSDVYSLGVVLYELLTGATPFDPRDLRSKAYAEIQRIILDEDPLPPSERVTPQIGRLLRGELDWIVLKCLEKDRSRRYDSAAALGDDLRRHLAGEAVLARPATTAYRVAKAMRRHKAFFAAAAVVLLVLVMGIVGTTLGMLRARRAESAALSEKSAAEKTQKRAEENARKAMEEAQRASAVGQMMRGIFELAQPESGVGGVDAKVSDLFRLAASQIDVRLAGQPREEMAARRALAESCLGLGLFDLAVTQLERAASISRQPPGGADSLEALDITCDLLMAMCVARMADRAEPIARDAVARAILHFGSNHPIAWKASNALAMAVGGQQRWEDARAILSELIEQIRERPEAAKWDRLGIYYVNLGTALRELVRYDEATRAVEASLRIMRADPAASMIWRGHAAHEMALILASKGDLEGAMSVANALLEEQRRYLGNKHPTTLTTLLAVSRVLMKTGQFDPALPLMQEYINSAAELYPSGNTTIAYQRWLTALLLLWKGDQNGADQMFRESISQHRQSVGHIDEISRLRWRDWVLASSGLGSGWRSAALRDQVWCAMEDLVRDHAPKELAREAFDVDGLRFRLARWRPDGNVGDWETGTLAELKRRPELEEGIHLLGLEAPRPGGAPVRKAFWLMSAPWQVSTFPVPRTHEMPQYWKQHLEGPLISRRTHKGLAVSSTLGCITREIERIDFYGIVATSEIDLPAGQYRVAMSVDDGSRLYIGDRLVMEDWGGHATRTRDGLVELGEGKHRLRVEFYQAASGHQLWLQFAPMNRAAKLAAASLGGSMPRLDSQIFEDEVKLLEPRPRPSTWPSYAHHLTRRGRFEESRVAYQTALAKDADDHACWFMQAHVLAYLGKAPEYAEHCNAMLDRFAATQDAVIAEATARACLLLRGHGDAQRLRPLLALSAETKATRTHWVCLTAGLAAYRAGEFEKALELLEEARPIFRTKSYPADAANEALIALCLKRLGRDASAAESARQAQAWFDEKAPILGVESLNHRGGAENWLICQIIFQEARAEFPATPEK